MLIHWLLLAQVCPLLSQTASKWIKWTYYYSTKITGYHIIMYEGGEGREGRERGREEKREGEEGKAYLPDCLLYKPQHIDQSCLSLGSLLPQAQNVDHAKPDIMSEAGKSGERRVERRVKLYLNPLVFPF